MELCRSGVVNEEAEKIESAKAAIVGGLGALLGSLPLLVGSRQSFLANLVTIGATAMTGTLFAVTYRLVPPRRHRIAGSSNCLTI